GRREVPRYVHIRRVVRPPAGHEVGVLVHHNLDAERADHLPRQLDVWLRASRGKDADFRRIRRERAGDEKTRKKLGADRPGQGDAATAQDSLDLNGRTTIARNGRSAGTEAREGLEERTHRTFLEARIARERRRTIEKRGHAREETQRRPGVPCVDRHPGWVQGIRNDPEPVRGWFNHRAERGHARNRSRGILRKERPTNATRAVRQGGEDDRTVSVALRRRSTNRSGDSRRADSVPQATTSREAIMNENFSRLVVRRDNAAEEGGARIVERTGNRYAGIAGGIHSDTDDPKRLERGAEGASTREDDRVRHGGAALQSARDRNLRRDRDLDAYLLSTASKDSLGTQSDKSRVESVRHMDPDSEAFGPSLRSR